MVPDVVLVVEAASKIDWMGWVLIIVIVVLPALGGICAGLMKGKG